MNELRITVVHSIWIPRLQDAEALRFRFTRKGATELSELSEETLGQIEGQVNGLIVKALRLAKDIAQEVPHLWQDQDT